MVTFSDLATTWQNTTSANNLSVLDVDELIDHIINNIRVAGINSHAITSVDLISRKYQYVDERIHQVTGYTSRQYKLNGPKFLFSKLPLSHKLGVVKSTIHQNRFLKNLETNQVHDYVLFREYNVIDPAGHPRRILHEVVEHIFDENKKIRAVIALQTDISHLSQATKFKYYIFSKSRNKIIYPSKPTSISNAFTKREKEIITLISEGMTSINISELLHLSLHTVKTHRKNILRKTNASNFIELINSLNA